MSSTTGTGGPVVQVLPEPHWTEGFRPISDRCRQAFSPVGRLWSIAHYSNDILDFVVRPAGTGLPAPGEVPADELPEREGRTGRRFVTFVRDLDVSLRDLDTGELMRVLVGTARGGLYCGRLKRRQYLVGITRSADAVEELDTRMNRLVTRIRREVHGLPDEILGGDPALPMAETGGSRWLRAENALGMDEASAARLRGIWHRHVNETDLQYAALYEDWSPRYSGDVFDAPDLQARFLGTGPEIRRRLYRETAGRLRTDVGRLRDILRSLGPDPVDRLVLDVQEGALLFHWTSPGTGRFLLGVTFNQPQVANAERRLHALAADLPPLP